MTTTAERYLDALRKLSPPGDALRTDEEASFLSLLDAVSAEFARVDDRAKALLLEAVPPLATELIDEWLEILGLPDDCAPTPTTTEEKQAAVGARLAGWGGHSFDDYQTLAASLGHTLSEVRKTAPFVAGGATAGDPLTNDEWANVVTLMVEAAATADSSDPRFECEADRRRRLHALLQFGWFHPDSILAPDGTGLLTPEGDFLLGV